jgi:hypothetical protein
MLVYNQLRTWGPHTLDNSGETAQSIYEILSNFLFAAELCFFLLIPIAKIATVVWAIEPWLVTTKWQ